MPSLSARRTMSSASFAEIDSPNSFERPFCSSVGSSDPSPGAEKVSPRPRTDSLQASSLPTLSREIITNVSKRETCSKETQGGKKTSSLEVSRRVASQELGVVRSRPRSGFPKDATGRGPHARRVQAEEEKPQPFVLRHLHPVDRVVLHDEIARAYA